MITVEWKVNSPSGITQMSWEDLGVKNKKEWVLLDKKTQDARINDQLKETESYIRPELVGWDY